jgi:hypothetical protein
MIERINNNWSIYYHCPRLYSARRNAMSDERVGEDASASLCQALCI